ncbi:MAG: GNAT family N-acetyltransferase [Bacteroidales bacterium]|nr:GNAT family N-acetyltransferase [Bacteroidales bacterium]
MSKIVALSKRLYIREIEEGDRELVYNLSQESSVMKGTQQDTEYVALYKQFNWEEANNPSTYNGMIFLKDSQEFVGKICMQHTDAPEPELGIDIMRSMQNRGYGPEAIVVFCRYYFELRKIDQVKVRISKDNKHSIHIFEKLGAQFVRSTSFVSENSLAMMRELLSDADLSELSQDSVREYVLHLPEMVEKKHENEI